MKKGFWLKRVCCLILAMLMLFVFCAMGHDCHQDHCPVCLLTASFGRTWSLIVIVFGLFCLRCWCWILDSQYAVAGGTDSLVALKVKLSD